MTYFKIFIVFFLLLVFTSCNNDVKKIYTAIDLSTYNKYKIVDTLYKTPSYIATRCEDTIKYFKEYVQLIKRNEQGSTHYFLLDPDAYLENDSTIIAYAPPFKSSSDEGAFLKNGIWVYTEFYEKTTDSTLLYKNGVSGADFVIDSTPTNVSSIKIPTLQGIYFYQNNSLIRVSADQSEDTFYSLNKNGFYFIPNTGRFFKEYDINSIK